MAPYLKNLAKQKQDIRYVVEAMNQVLQGAIQVLRIADGGGGVSDFPGKSVTYEGVI